MIDPARRVLPMGEGAVLVETDGPASVAALRAALEESPPEGVSEIVPALRTVLVSFAPDRIALERVRHWILSAPPAPVGAGAAAVDLPIVYDGEDLGEVAEELGIGREELIARHASARWTVVFTGFAPGFGYLVSDQWPFRVPRRRTPRTRVPAGAVGLAAEFTGAYPRPSPGGWRLIGTTRARLFDPDAARPALLEPGAEVRFRPERARVRVPRESSGSAPPAAPAPETAPGLALRIEQAPGATVQDQGRPGWARLGVARSGALDRAALRLANRMVGNAPSAAGLEIPPAGASLVAGADGWFALTGAWAPAEVAGRTATPFRAHPWRAGERLSIGRPERGARVYLAVRGGLSPDPVLGSRSTDTLSGLGPVIGPGTTVPIGSDAAGPVPPVDAGPWGWISDPVDVAVLPGPRRDYLTPEALRALTATVWTVSPASDRVGMRLEGPPLERARGDEVPSEPMVPGAVQVPPDGHPVVLLADGPVTGGYPVAAVVATGDQDALGQALPGTRVRFHRSPGW